MMPELGFSQVQMGHIFSAFMLGYAIFQTPAGLAGRQSGVVVKDLGWPFVFYSAAALSVLAGLLWLFLRLPPTRVESNAFLSHQVVTGEIS